MKNIFIGVFFAFVNLFALTAPTQNTYAVPDTNNTTDTSVVTETTETTTTETAPAETTTTTPSEPLDPNADLYTKEDLCKEGLDTISWLFCPKVENGADAVDWLYEKIESVLEINPISGESGNIIGRIWEVCRGITNIVFVILLLMVVLSQITGIGITNYGIKRALPKLIIAAIAVNLSFYICSIGVDLSNVIGVSIRNVFSNIEASATGTTEVYKLSEMATSYAQYFDALAGLAPLKVAGITLLFETGTIFLLVPAVLVALVAVLSGFITIALRQVVVVLCVMIAPLAIVAIVFPNTYNLFRKWRSTLMSMLVFFPMFSLLFGASSLAGFAVTQAANGDGFMALIGMIIQLAPLILCWKMMKMSGTILGTVHGTVSGFMTKAFVNPTRGWAASHRAEKYARTLALNPYTPSARLMQFLSNRRIGREANTAEYAALAKNRALALNVGKHYRYKNGKLVITADGEEAYELQARNMDYTRQIMRDKNNFNKGLGQLNAHANAKQKARLDRLDDMNVKAADALFTEQIRGASIDYHNAQGRERRFNEAINAHMDASYGYKFGYQRHANNNMGRYKEILDIMDGDVTEAHYAAAAAASAAVSQRQARQGQFQKYFDSTVPTQDVVYRLQELTKRADSSNYMNDIIAGMRTLAQRGDTDLLINAIQEVTADHKLKLGTQAAQALSSFLMFEVKDTQPLLRRMGKYMNLETARLFNTGVRPDKRRKRADVDMDEYINGGYEYVNEHGEIAFDQAKRGAVQLLMGTSFKGVERLTYDDIEAAVKHAAGGNKKKAIALSDAIVNAITPNVVSDQFNYPSGSEQINSMGKFYTGYEAKYDDPNDPNSVRYVQCKGFDMDHYYKRTRDFLRAHVANQIARSKSDNIGRMEQLFKDKAKEDFFNANNGRLSDEYKIWLKERAAYGEQKSNVDDQTAYAHWLFRNSLQESVRGGLAKTINKGFQGDTKENLMRIMGYNDYKNDSLIGYEIGRFAVNATDKNNKNKKAKYDEYDDDDDDGILMGYNAVDYSAMDNDSALNSIFNETRDAHDTDGARADLAKTFLCDNPNVNAVQKEQIRGIINYGYTDIHELEQAVRKILNK